MTAAASAIGAERACPFCSGAVQADTALCPHCGKFSRPVQASATASQGGVLDRVDAAIAAVGAGQGGAVDRLRDLLVLHVPGGRTLRLIVGGALLALGFPSLIRFFLTGPGPGPFLLDILAFGSLGLTIVSWPKMLRPDADRADPGTNRLSGAPSLTLLGYDTNLAFVQLMALAAMIAAVAHSNVQTAWNAAVVCTLLTPLLFRTRAHVLSLAVGGAGLVYLLYLWSVWDFGYRIEALQRARLLPDYVIPFGSIAWTVMVLAAMPQLQLLRIGSFGLGRLRGDAHLSFMGSRVPLAFASAALLCAAWRAGWIIWYAPRWLPYALDFG